MKCSSCGRERADFTGDGLRDVVVLTFGEFTLYVNVTRASLGE